MLTALTSPRRVFNALQSRLLKNQSEIAWDERVERWGAYSVIDARHGPDELAYVTERQKQILFPRLRSLLDGTERRILDFGCGSGRFTADLGQIVGGRAVG